MSSQKKIEANRKNALQSTGPKTDEGKAIVAKNAVKYGIYSKDIVLHTGPVREDPREFEELLLSLIDDLKPVGTMETILVEKIAANSWRLKRLFRAECGAINSRIMQEASSSDFDLRTPKCPINPGELAHTEEDYSFDTLIGDISELSDRLALTNEELAKDEDFLDFANDKYPDRKLYDLSIHQLKRLRSAYRSAIRDRLEEKAKLARYLRYSHSEHLSCLVPNEKILRYGTTIERSILKDLAALKQLQAMRGKE